MRNQASLLAAAATLLLASASFRVSGDGRLAPIERGPERGEYHARPSRVGFEAPNRTQNLNIYFDSTGIRVHDRTALRELFSLSPVGMGRGDDLAPLPPGDVSSQGARVEIRRKGFVEWYENSAAGLEQGFTLAEPPAGEGPLVVELALRGAKASQAEDAVIFSAGSGHRVRYDGLVAVDASGRELIARLSTPDPERVRIEVEDAGAAYPLVIDPLLTNTADSLIDSNVPDSGIPHVAPAGDVNGDGYDDVMIGPGYAYVFMGSASGIASGGLDAAAVELQRLTPSDNFGRGMAGAGDVNGDGYDDVIVGNYFDIYNPGGWAGIFWGSASGTTVTANHGSIWSGAMDGFVYGGIVSVAGAGDVNGDGYDDVILSTTRTKDDAREGVAAVFLGSAAGIDFVYVFQADTLITWPQGPLDEHVPSSVAGAGDVNGDGYDDVIVGAPEFHLDGGSTSGVAMVFHGSASGIASRNFGDTLLTVDDYYYKAGFGESVSGAGDVNGDGYDDVIVGAPRLGIGAAFVYLGSASGIPDSLSYESPTAIPIESDQPDASDFGWSVAGAGDVNGDGHDDVIVGAPYYDAGQQDEGAAFVFLGNETGISTRTTGSAYARLESDQSFAYLGVGVAGAGDVNGDGLDDVITTSWAYDAGEANEGAAFVYLGQADADGDGYANSFDADFDQNGGSGLTDFGTFRFCYGRTIPVSGGPADDPTCAESDMDGDGVVGPADFGLFRSEFGTPPGP